VYKWNVDILGMFVTMIAACKHQTCFVKKTKHVDIKKGHLIYETYIKKLF